MKKLYCFLPLILLISFYDYAFSEIINIPEDFQLIQQAIDNSSINDTILLEPGTYNENILLSTHPLTIASNDIFGLGSPPWALSTIIAPTDHPSNLLYVSSISADTVRINGLSFQNSNIYNQDSTSFGAAIHIDTSIVNIENCYFTANAASVGGAVYINNGYLDIKKCEFQDNSAFEGGAIYAYFSVINSNESVFLSNFSLRFGGCINGGISSGIIKNNTFLYSFGGLMGGALYCQHGSWNIHNNFFYENSARQFGGAVGSAFNDTLEINNNIFLNNVVIDTPEIADDGFGGAISAGIEGDVIDIYNNTFFGNGARLHGGAVFLHNQNLQFHNNVLIANYGKRTGAIKFGMSNAVAPDIYVHNNSIKYTTHWPGLADLYDFGIGEGNTGTAHIYENDSYHNFSDIIGRPTGSQGYLDFANNYWGHETGPYHGHYNPDGLGDSIYIALVLPEWSPEPFWDYSLSWDNESYDFGFVHPEESTTQYIGLTNNGEEDFEIFSLLWIKESEEFSISFPDSFLIMAGETISIPVTFSPSDTVNYFNVLSTTSYDHRASGSTIEFTGTGIFNAVNENSEFQPTSFHVSSPKPNPFNSVTTLDVFLPNPGLVNLSVYNVLGEKIIDDITKYYLRGKHNIPISLNEKPSGIYFISIKSNGIIAHKKCLFIK